MSTRAIGRNGQSQTRLPARAQTCLSAMLVAETKRGCYYSQVARKRSGLSWAKFPWLVKLESKSHPFALYSLQMVLILYFTILRLCFKAKLFLKPMLFLWMGWVIFETNLAKPVQSAFCTRLYSNKSTVCVCVCAGGYTCCMSSLHELGSTSSYNNRQWELLQSCQCGFAVLYESLKPLSERIWAPACIYKRLLSFLFGETYLWWLLKYTDYYHT